MTNPEPTLQDNTEAGSNAAATEPSQPEKDWPAKCVSEALKAHAVPAAVSGMLVQQLEGVARERTLKASELTALAQILIAALDDPVAEEPAP
jgi:hypothetical protein